MSEVQITIKPNFSEAVSGLKGINKELSRMVSLAAKSEKAMSKIRVGGAGSKAKSESKKADREAISSARKVAREYERAEKARVRATERANRQIQRARARHQAQLSKAGKGAMGMGMGALGMVGISSAAGMGLAVSEGKKALALSERMTALKIQGRGVGETGTSTSAIEGSVFGNAKKWGFDPSEVLAGMEQMVSKTGDMQFAMNSIGVLSKVARATGADIGDLGGVASDMMQKFNIKTPEELEQALAVLNMQAKRGAVELKDFASYLPDMAAGASRFGMDDASGMKTLGGLAQLAKQSTGSVAESSTAVSAMFADLVKKSGLIKSKYGVNVIDDKTKRGNEITDILPELMKATSGDPRKLLEIFGERGIKAVSPMVAEYQKAKKEGKTDDEAKLAVAEMIANASHGTDAVTELNRDAAEQQLAASSRMKSAWASVQEQFMRLDFDAISSAIVGLIPALHLMAKGITHVAKLLGMFSPEFQKEVEVFQAQQWTATAENERLGKVKEVDELMKKREGIVESKMPDDAKDEALTKLDKDIAEKEREIEASERKVRDAKEAQTDREVGLETTKTYESTGKGKLDALTDVYDFIPKLIQNAMGVKEGEEITLKGSVDKAVAQIGAFEKSIGSAAKAISKLSGGDTE